MQGGLINIENVFNYVPTNLRRELSDDDQIKSWALQALRTVNHSQKYVKDISFHDIENHSITLPDDVYKIYKVSYAASEPTNLQILSLCQCEAQTDSANFSLSTDCLPIYHELFLKSDYYQSGFRPMAYKKSRLTDNYVCNVQWGGCYGFYSLNATGTHMTFSEQSGFVAIEYFAEPKDTSGSFLVPDYPQLWLGLAAYVKAKFYEDRSILAEQNSYQLYQSNLLEARSYLNEMRGIFKLQGIDTSLHREIIYGKSRILRAHLLIRHHD